MEHFVPIKESYFDTGIKIRKIPYPTIYVELRSCDSKISGNQLVCYKDFFKNEKFSVFLYISASD